MPYLELNKWYQTRNNDLVQITSVDPDTHVLDPFTGSNGRTYYPTGEYKRNDESKCDIVREVSHIGVLMEIICEEGYGCTIETTFDAGACAKVFDYSGRIVVVEYGRYKESFETLIAAYLRFKN